MKRSILVCVMCVCLCFSLCGCAVEDVFAADANDCLVASIGFDATENNTKIFIETLIVNSEDANAPKEIKVLEGEGKTASEAFENAYKKATGPLLLNHCGVIAIGEGVPSKRFDDICNFFYNKDAINLSARFVATKSAKDLLSCQPVSSVAVGYDIIGMLSQMTEHSGSKFKNRFYEIESLRSKPYNVFVLPYFSVSNDGFSTDSLCVFKNDALTMKLTPGESEVYYLASDSRGRGEILLGSKSYTVKNCCTTYHFYEDDGIKAQLHISLDIDSFGQNKEKIKEGINELFLLSKDYNTDVFGLFNIFYHQKKELCDKSDKTHTEFYQNLKLTVEIE